MSNNIHQVIGIDFGTSTTMIKAREYDDSTSDELVCKAVTFTQGGTASTPTLIRKHGETSWYGFDADQSAYADSVLYNNFKLLLKSDSEEERTKAVELIEEFFKYLFERYNEQERFLFCISDKSPEYRTMVSYPAQWDETQQNIMLEAAKKAGFRNVVGQDEASAAVNCILKAKQQELEDAGYLMKGKPLNILVVDMGAGTTDLAFVEVNVGVDGISTEIKEIWPPRDSEHMFGGSMIDVGLLKMIKEWMLSSGINETTAGNISKGQQSHIKLWKETTVSALLKENRSVTDCLTVSNIFQMMGMPLNAFTPLDKTGFETLFRNEISEFVNIINTAPKNLRDNTELVILTGGNSQWYWIDEILLGNNTGFGDPGLKQIKNNSRAILRMELPAETVSRGLVYGTAIDVSRMKTYVEQKNNDMKSTSEQKTAAPEENIPQAQTSVTEQEKASSKESKPQTQTAAVADINNDDELNEHLYNAACEFTKNYFENVSYGFRIFFVFNSTGDNFFLSLSKDMERYLLFDKENIQVRNKSTNTREAFSWDSFLSINSEVINYNYDTYVKLSNNKCGINIVFRGEKRICKEFEQYFNALINHLKNEKAEISGGVTEQETAASSDTTKENNSFDEKCWELAKIYTAGSGRKDAEYIRNVSKTVSAKEAVLIEYKSYYHNSSDYLGFKVYKGGVDVFNIASKKFYSWNDFIHAQIYTKGLFPLLYIASQYSFKGFLGDRLCICYKIEHIWAVRAYLKGLQDFLKKEKNT